MKNMVKNKLSNVIILITFALLIFFQKSAANSKPESVPAAIVFAIVDLKYDGENIKICEFGDGLFSCFYGGEYSNIFSKNQIWINFSNYLNQFNLPIFYTDRSNKYIKDGNKATPAGKLYFNYNMLPETSQEKINPDLSKISEYGSIIVAKNTDIKKNSTKTTFEELLKFGSIVINKETESYFNNKLLTSLLFNSDELIKYRPKFLIFEEPPVKLSKKQINVLKGEILKKIGSEYYVLKPVDQFCGRGVIIFHKSEIEKILENIFNKSMFKIKAKSDTSYDYWIKNQNKSNYFIIEEFCSSKTILVGNKEYDPTMRVIFTIKADNNELEVDLLGAYWKLPKLAITDVGNFNIKHKSKIDKSRICSAMVSQDDFDKVSAILRDILPKIYLRILNQSILSAPCDRVVSLQKSISMKNIEQYIKSKISLS